MSLHPEVHRSGSVGRLRTAVPGANDGILSTASLIVGVASARGTHSSRLVAGVAEPVSGAMAMAAGEYVSVHSQADTEDADLTRERAEPQADDRGEHGELAAIYVGRGLDPALAAQVADHQNRRCMRFRQAEFVKSTPLACRAALLYAAVK